jgi:DNA gyrase subunit B
MLCFTNNIRQRDGGTHLVGYRAALTRIVNSYATASGAMKKEKITLSGEDAREGLTCVLSVKVPDPKFSSQTKDKLVSSEVRPVVESLVGDKLGQWFEEHPQEAKQIVAKVLDAAQGPRADPPQGCARHGEPAGQACRLPGARSRQVRTLHRRG